MQKRIAAVALQESLCTHKKEEILMPAAQYHAPAAHTVDAVPWAQDASGTTARQSAEHIYLHGVPDPRPADTAKLQQSLQKTRLQPRGPLTHISQNTKPPMGFQCDSPACGKCCNCGSPMVAGSRTECVYHLTEVKEHIKFGFYWPCCQTVGSGSVSDCCYNALHCCALQFTVFLSVQPATGKSKSSCTYPPASNAGKQLIFQAVYASNIH